MFPHHCLYAGNFNCRHADWGYNDNSPDGECLSGWASINCLALLYNAKDAACFYSGHWNTGTNPDLAFAISVGPNSRSSDRRVLEKFSRSQHRPSLITRPRFAMAVPSMPEETGARPVGMGLPRAAWVKLNRLRTGVGLFHSSMHKWSLTPSPNCECGASEQTADHVLTACSISGTTWSKRSDGFG